MDEHVSDNCLIDVSALDVSALDVSELDLTGLLAHDRESVLGQALTRLLASAGDSPYSSFSANI